MKAATLRKLTRLVVKPLFSPRVPIALQRRGLAAGKLLTQLPRRAKFTSENLSGVPAECAHDSATQVPGCGILYLHGGGFCIGTPQTYRPLTARFALGCGVAVYAPDYRLAPEQPFPAAIDDVLVAYRALLDRGMKRIVVAGDSAGGQLALALTLCLREQQLPLPAGLVLISPLTDMSLQGESIQQRAGRDPMLSPGTARRWSTCYLGNTPADHPLCSPLFADLGGFPSTCIVVGTEEILLDDSLRLEKKLRDAQVPVQLHVGEGLWHDYPMHAGVIAEADEAVSKMLAFMRPLLQ